MNDFDKILWGFIFSGVGIVFGWTLNQLGQWLRARKEDEKNLKIVLFNLLETYFLFTRSDFDKVVQKITNKVLELTPMEQRTEEGERSIYKLYSELLTNMYKPELLEKLKIVEEDYQNSIKTLASIDPLTAYYLNGKTNIMDRFDTLQGWFDNLKEQYPIEKNEIEFGVKHVLRIIKPDIVNDTLLSLEKDIRNIAWKINPYVWYKSIKVLKQLKLRANEKLDKEIEELFNKLLPSLTILE